MKHFDDIRAIEMKFKSNGAFARCAGLLVILALAGPAPMAAQGGSVVPAFGTAAEDRAKAEKDYREAFNNWAREDPEGQLDRGTVEEKVNRIQRARQLRSEVMDKKAALADATARFFDSYASLFADSGKGNANPAEMKKQVEDITGSLIQQQDNLSREIGSLGTDTKSAILREALKNEQKALNDAAQQLLRQSLSLGHLGENEQGLSDARKKVASSLQAIVVQLKDEKAGISDSKQAWDRYYSKMEDVAGRPLGPRPPAPVTAQPVLKPPDSSLVGVSGLYGGQFELRQGPVDLAGGNRLTKAVLALREDGGRITGELVITYDGPSGNHSEPLMIEGASRPAKATLNWTDRQNGADHHGQLEIEPPDDREPGGMMILNITTSTGDLVPQGTLPLNRVK